MTAAQFATACMADAKWVENSARLLGRRLRHTVAEAYEFGLIGVLNRELGIPLVRAEQLAREVLAAEPGEEHVIAGRGDDSVAGVVVHRARYLSSFNAALSAALEHGGPRRRGPRPISAVAPKSSRIRSEALSRAAEYGVDLGLLREGLKLSRAERLAALDANAEFLRAIRKAG